MTKDRMHQSENNCLDYPKRVKQHKNESDSFAIIVYKLRDLGIFRNMTASDYGVDFELEVVSKDRVEGHCIKVQVKAKESGLIRKKSGDAIVGGIRQSTLAYWAELSYSLPVVAMAVNLEDEKIFVSDILFWQVIELLDGTNKLKSINLGNRCDDSENIAHLRRMAYEYNLRDFIYAHKWILRNFRKICDMYADACTCDGYMSIYEPNLFETFLEQAKIFLYDYIYFAEKKDKNFSILFSYQYYVKKSYNSEPYNIFVKQGMDILFPVLLCMLNLYQMRVVNSSYYWVNKDILYLKLVYETDLDAFAIVDLQKYCCEHYNDSSESKTRKFHTFLMEMAEKYKLDLGNLLLRMQNDVY